MKPGGGGGRSRGTGVEATGVGGEADGLVGELGLVDPEDGRWGSSERAGKGVGASDWDGGKLEAVGRSASMERR